MIKNLHQNLLFRLLLFFLFFIASWSAWGQTADLEIHGTAYHNQNAGSITTFTLYVTNNGPDDATGVVVTDNLNASWNFTLTGNHAESHGTLSSSGNNLTWTVGTVRNGETAVLVFNATNNYANWQIPSPFNNTNSATVSSATTDSTPGNNTTGTITSINDSATHNLSITQDTTNANPIQGTNVTFTFTLNKSGGAGTNIEVMDILPPGFTYVSSSTTTGSYSPSTNTWVLGINSYQNFPRTLTITATATTPGDYTNVAFISKASPDTAVANNIASVSGTIQATNGNEADLAVTKTGARQNYSGGVATFNIAVTNNGPDKATDVVVSDFLDSGWSFPSPYDNYLVTEGTVTYTSGNKKFEWEIDSLPVGETVYFTYTVDNIGDGNNQHWDNTATAQSAELDPDITDNSPSVTASNVNGGADIELTKNVTPDDPYIGENVVFTITAQRIESLSGGNADATNVRVFDILPSGYAYVSHNVSAGTYDESTGIWTIGTINSDTARTLEITATALASGEYENTAVLFHDKPDPDVTNQIATATIEDPIPDPLGTDLSITKVVDQDNPVVMTNVTFTLTATNNGDNDTTGVVVTDLLPDGYEYVSDNPSVGTYDESTGEWTIGNLANDATATLDIVAKVLETGNYTNTATIAGNGTDPNPANNTSEDVTVTPYFPSADLQITSMTIDDDSPSVGNNIVFTINVINDGPDAASGVIVDAMLPSGYQYVSSTGSYNNTTGVWTIGNLTDQQTTSIQITAKVLATGNYNFNGEVSGAVNDPDTNNNTSEEDISLSNIVDLEIEKTVAGDDEDGPVYNEEITFYLKATNHSTTTTATNVVVTDIIENGFAVNSISPDYDGQYNYDPGTKTLTWNVGTLAPGTSTPDDDDGFWIKVRTLATLTHENTATVTGDQPDDNAGNNSDTVAVSAVIDVIDLQVKQRACIENETCNTIDFDPGIAYEPPTVDIGDTVNFTIGARNASSEDVTQIVVTDLLADGFEYVVNSAVVPPGTTFDPVTGIWDIGTMDALDELVLTFQAIINEWDPNFGVSYLNIAQIKSNNEAVVDELPVNNASYIILSPTEEELACDVNAEDPVLEENFGSGASEYGPGLPSGTTNLAYVEGLIEDGEYTIAKNAQDGAANWQSITDASGTPDGYFMIINSDYDPREFFRYRIEEDFCANTRYTVSFSAITVNSEENYDYCTTNEGGLILPEVGYFIQNQDGKILGSGTSGKIPYNEIAEWQNYSFVITTSGTDEYVDLVLFNMAPGGCGNDLAIDDISVYACMTPPIDVNMEIESDQLEVCGGEDVSMTVLYEDVNPDDGIDYVWPPASWNEYGVVYQWQRSDDAETWVDIPGETTDTYTIEDFAPEDEAYYRLLYAQTGNIDKVSCRFPSEKLFPVFNATPVLNPIESIEGVDYICGDDVPGGALHLTNDYEFSNPDYAEWDDDEEGHHYFVWESSNPEIATIDELTGEVTAVSLGTTTITYTVWSPKGDCSDFVEKDISILEDCPTCVEDPTPEEGGVVSPVGISTYKEQLPGWPENIPNGYIVLESGSKGFVITRIAEEGAIAEPKEGMLIYDDEDDCIKLYYSSEWHCIDQDCN